MEYILEVLIWMLLGGYIHHRYIVWKTDIFFDKILSSKEEEEKPDYIKISIETHGSIFLVYDEKSNFLVQGNTKNEVQDKLKKMFPDKNFACEEKNLREVGFIK
jgi:hypothetical protein